MCEVSFIQPSQRVNVPKTPVIRFTKDEYKDCTTLQDYFNVTANHINTKYTKAKYAKFAEIDETEVSMITFPDEKENFRYDDKGTIKTFQNTKYGNFTAITIPVATADLEDNDHDPDSDVLTKDNKYVKVMLGDEIKYIAKTKLPYINIRWNNSSRAYYPYVCIYDLKTDLGAELENPLICVKPTDDSILPSTTNKNDNSAVVFFNSGNNWQDTWVIERRVAEDIYKNEYTPDKLVLGSSNDIDYFMFKKDVEAAQNPKVIAKYRKITLANGDVLYAKEGEDQFFTKIQNNANNLKNYIIVDENGNMLTKPVTAPNIFGVTSEVTNNNFMSQVDSISSPNLYAHLKTYTREPLVPPKNSGDLREQPDDKEQVIDGKYRGHDTAHLYRDYRIPAFERVYKMKDAFNLKEDSYYSFFDIRKPVDLWRVNYHYLNVNEIKQTVDGKDSPYWKVDDMFFTTIRAGWID